MLLDLSKGGLTLDLTKEIPTLTSMNVGVNWGQIQVTETKTSGGFMGFGGKTEEVVKGTKTVDLDLSLILYGSNNSHISTVYFGNLSHTGVKHSGDDRSGDSSKDDSDNETIKIDFSHLPENVQKMAVVLVSFSGQPFGKIPYAGIRMYNTSKGNVEKVAEANIELDSSFASKVSLVYGIFEKNGNNWEYKIVNKPESSHRVEQLVDVAKKYF